MIAVLCGGVGAARFLSGLLQVVDPGDVVAVVNTGDDTELHGLCISPDLDTITYTLSGRVNPVTGWGFAGDDFTTMQALEALGGDTWFRLGNRDLATHLYRTGRLRAGASLSEVTAELARAFGLGLVLLPMSDDPVRTVLRLADGGEVGFQDYFVRLRHSVAVRGVRFSGAEQASPAPGVLESLAAASIIVIAPSNPVVSIDPILSVPGVRALLGSRRAHVVGVSPIVAGAALKGPADRLLVELGGEATAAGVARWMAEVCGTLVIDAADSDQVPGVEACGMRCVVTPTVMGTPGIAAALARTVLSSGGPDTDRIPVAG
ncbi:MAG TPA: 2-phospho-L-lactate transferase [Acidimicrobiales bacterium]|nr:2-phospho-L-lactate transferase [Acidimicrobiales bacterium]